ncbi:hypothetical protein [Gordonia malaquae]|uniref:hypothetical protein n=1 Tax=Gordonia malaquae TaxID=410332 RepID=UPI0030FE44B3
MAAWAAVIVAVLTILRAGSYAKQQISEAQSQRAEAEAARHEQAEQAQRLEDERAQPNVVVFMQDDPVHWTYEDLVIKNFGQTPAIDIEIGFDPELAVTPYTDLATGQLVTTLGYPATIPFLAPGQEWRTAWDSGRARVQYVKEHPEAAELMNSFAATVKYKDSKGRQHTTRAVLDWSVFESRMKVTTKSVHHVAKSLGKQGEKLDQVNKNLASISARLDGFGDEHRGVWVYPTSDTDQRNYIAREHQERARESADARARLDSMVGQLLPHESDGGDESSGSSSSSTSDEQAN